MANVTTVDITTDKGSDIFPVDKNKFLTAVETLAVQNIRGVKNSNVIEDAFYEYDVNNGKVIEEAIIEMAKGAKFTPIANGGNPDLAPKDPVLYVKYWNNWESKQYKTTKRYDEIRSILAQGKTADDVAGEIDASLTEGEGFDDYGTMRKAIEEEAGNTDLDASTALFGGKVPATMKGVIYCLRQMYNVCKATNNKGGVPTAQGVDPSDIRIAISEKALNLMDVTELANVFNLTKEELFGKLVILPEDASYTGEKVLVYDRKHLGRGTRVYEYAQQDLPTNRYMIATLNTERCYFKNSLFKAFGLDISKAMTAAETALLTTKA